MISFSASYNERSWAIDLIARLKLLAAQYNRSIQSVGGEQTISAEGGSLFPDVLLFGDRATARILQGWELKLPDTDINDQDFRQNAEDKARALGLDSFLLWNVSYARLYVRDASTDRFIIENEWNELADITSRQSVFPNRQRWECLAAEIVSYLNDLFDRGTLEGRQFIDAYRSGGITGLIMENVSLVANALSTEAQKDATFRAQTTLWWDKHQEEYSGTTKETVLAQAIISNWIGKFLFAHILRETDTRARYIEDIREETTPADALALFRQLSQDCDFWTIFADALGLAILPDKLWRELKQFNRLLADLRVGAIDQAQLADVMETTVEAARRKLRGQYPTPTELAQLLVRLCVRNTIEDRVLDPCCGSGTIARAALEQKLNAGVLPNDASGSVFAGDLDPQAAQIATFALAKPSLMNVPLRIFQRNIFCLTPSTEICFRNPTDGTQFSEELGEFQAIVSNLPFVAQSGRQHYRVDIQSVAATLNRNNLAISGRADIAAYLPFVLHPLLAVRGRLGIIMTNAWLGTDWGNAFYEAIRHYYDLKCVITSGAGRWFQNSDVVTNILVMEKKAHPKQISGDVSFVVLKRPLEALADDESQSIAAAQIELGQTQNDTMTIRAVSPDTLSLFRKYGLGGNAQFVNCDWILHFPLTRLNSLFTIRRGERRGMNRLFYPGPNHGIETDYIRPLAKNISDFQRLCGTAAKEAFSCSRSEEELQDLNHHGALRWIERFRTSSNISRLSRPNARWYEMKTDTMTELVMSINYGERLFVARLDPPAFVDQRLIRLDPKMDVDMGLCHALLNSSISMFIIEGLGFGRGLGALDLNKNRIEDYMHMLNPSLLDQHQAQQVKNAFLPLLNRDICSSIADELEQQDRQFFDDAIISAYGLTISRESIYECLRTLVGIRLTANQSPRP